MAEGDGGEQHDAPHSARYACFASPRRHCFPTHVHSPAPYVHRRRPPDGADAGAVWQGVSTSFLQQLKADLSAVAGLSTEATVHDVVEAVIKPRHSTGPYCQIAERVGETAEATIFVSYAWKYRAVDLLDALIAFGAEHSGSYFWIDMLMVDQNQAHALPDDFWTVTFRKAIGRIGHTVMVLSPWEDPLPLTRAWCLFELHSSVLTGASFDVLLPDRERTRLRDAVLESPTTLTDAMVAVDLKRAEASVAADKEMIFASIAATDGGIHGLNVQVLRLLRDWVLAAAKQLCQHDAWTDDQREVARLFHNVGRILGDNGVHDGALDMHRKCLTIREATLGTEHPDTASSYNNIGSVLQDKGDHDGALDMLRKCLAIREATLGTEHPDTATSYNNIGLVLQDKGDHDGALDMYRKCLAIEEATLGTEHPATASSYNNIGSVLKAKGDYADTGGS